MGYFNPMREATRQRGYRQLAEELSRQSPRQRHQAREAREAIKEIGPVVYYVERGDYIKIGFTTNFRQRMWSLRVPRESILALEAGDGLVEEQRHARFAKDRVFGEGLGREHYRRTPALVEHINILRVGMGVPRL